jgi:tetratricopeptide (TPR) repeat protein
LHERNPLTHYHYAVDVLLKQGRRDEACRHLRRVLELNPRKARHRRQIERALQGCK